MGRVIAFAAALDFRSRRVTVSAARRRVRPDRRLQQGGLPVSPGTRPVRHCCSRAVARPPARPGPWARSAGLSAPVGASPAFAGHPALCCSDFPLRIAPQRPSRSFTPINLVKGPHASSACGIPICGNDMVPKEGFEPSRPNGHYALNVARLPIPPLRHEVEPTIGFEPMTCCLRNSCSAAELRRPYAAQDSTMPRVAMQDARIGSA